MPLIARPFAAERALFLLFSAIRFSYTRRAGNALSRLMARRRKKLDLLFLSRITPDSRQDHTRLLPPHAI